MTISATKKASFCCTYCLLKSFFSLFQAVIERFAQIQPKLMFTVNAVFYKGKIHNHTNKVKKVIEGKRKCLRDLDS